MPHQNLRYSCVLLFVREQSRLARGADRGILQIERALAEGGWESENLKLGAKGGVERLPRRSAATREPDDLDWGPSVRHHGQKRTMADLGFEFQTILSDIARILLAFALALPIGWERRHGRRSIAFRTLPIVALAACGFALIIDTSAPADNEARARVLRVSSPELASLAVGLSSSRAAASKVW